MSNAALPGRGAVLRMRDKGTSGPFIPIAELRDVSDVLPEELQFEDGTTQDTSMFAAVQIPIDVQMNPINFEVFWLPEHPSHDHVTGVRSKQRNRTLMEFQLKVPSTTMRLAFDGYFVRMNPRMPVRGLMGAQLVIQPTGGVTEEADV